MLELIYSALKTRQKFATEPKTVPVCTAQQQKLVNIQQFYFN